VIRPGVADNRSASAETMPPIAILAGGLATRLRPVTSSIPKSMVPVAGAPFIQHQLRLLVREGFRDIVLCIGNLGDQIESFVGDGSRFHCSIRYSKDGTTPLGTGGALLRAAPLLGRRFMVIYGDSYLDTSYARPWKSFLRCGLPALMTVYRNEGRWDKSNVDFYNGTIRYYDKVATKSTMRHIDYGLGIFCREALTFASEQSFDLADLYSSLARRGLLAGCEINERFHEIGSPVGLADTDQYLRNGAGS
jgi:NDP-sugar pyrophosphorylase family protein